MVVVTAVSPEEETAPKLNPLNVLNALIVSVPDVGMVADVETAFELWKNYQNLLPVKMPLQLSFELTGWD